MWLIVIVSLIILVIVYYFITKNYSIKAKDDFDVYKTKDFLLNKTEKIAYDRILHFFKEQKKPFTILPKVRLTDFIWTPKENRNAYLRIQTKFVDFLILSFPQLQPKLAIFIVNPENKAKMQSLNIIEPTLRSAGIKLIKIEPKEIFEDELIEKIKEGLKWL